MPTMVVVVDGGRSVPEGMAPGVASTDASGAADPLVEALVPGLPWKACVFDRRVAVVPLDLSTLLGGMVISTEPLLVRMLLAAHRSGWDAGAEPVSRVPAHLREVVELLVAGLPDDRAARRAGVSPRTYSRRVTELMDLLGVRSRFQAGAELSRRGWNTPGPE